MSEYTIDDAENLWEQHADEYGADFSDEYPLDTAIFDYEAFGYAFMLGQVLAIKDDIDAERYHRWVNDEEAHQIDFEKEF